jgi:hypothetical protein
MVTQRDLSKIEWISLSLATLLFTLVSAQSLGMIGNPRQPSVLAPGGLPLFIVALPFGPWAVFFVGAVFLLVELFVMMNDGLPARKNACIVGVVAILSASFIALSWNDDHDRHYAVAVALLSALFGVLLLLLLFFTRRSRSALSTLLVHFLLFAWIATYAFPWLGETL